MPKIVLPVSRDEVTLKDFLTVGESVQIKKIYRASAKVSFEKVGKEMQPKIDSFDFDAEDLAEMKTLELLVQEVMPAAINGVPQKPRAFSREWYLALHEADGDALIEKVNEIRRPKAPSPPAA